MENFKEIAEKCLAGELSGRFVLRDNKTLHSKCLIKMKGCIRPYYIDGYYYSDNGNCYNRHLRQQNNDIINFIPDHMQEQIKIDIPESKVPIVEQSEKGVVITWKEKELTYNDIESKYVWDPDNKIENLVCEDICTSNASERFYRKIEAYRKLINIRNYFGLDPHRIGDWVICISMNGTYYTRATRQPLCYEVVFSKQEHAQAAIKMLGDELKYLFEPW